LTGGHCARLRAQGVRLIGVAVDERERQALRELGLDAITDAADPDSLLAEINGHEPRPTSATSFKSQTQAKARRGGGSIVAVVGSKGAPGASECAASLAALAARQWRSFLVELDLLGGSFDIRLGADPQQGSILGLARALEAGAPAVAELLERWLTVRPGWPPVLLGRPADGQALAELSRPGVVATCLGALAETAPLTVVDVGFLLGELDEVPLLAQAHREALVSADAVLLVLGARDQQLRAGLSQLDLLLLELELVPERLRVVLNGVGAPGANSLHAVEQTLVERLATHELTLDARLPWDGKALAQGTRQGLPLATARERSAYGRAVAGLLDELFLPQAPTPKGRKRKLTRPQASTVALEEVALPWRS
jgi:Flp pilus assembly CpaE family ATPase